MLLNNKLCADAGTVNCPCYLAEYGKCIVCTRLNGPDRFCRTDESAGEEAGNSCRALASCDCQWQGTCIYNEYLQNKRCIKDWMTDGDASLQSDVSGERRQGCLCKIQKIKWFEDDLAVMRISVPRGMAEKASLPGSFVFVKAPGMESCFSFPVSVMRSDYEDRTLELAIKVTGPKSRALLDRYRDVDWYKSADQYKNVTWDELQIGNSNGESYTAAGEHESPLDDVCGFVELRGLYRNGLLGAEKLMEQGAGNVRGAGVAWEAVKPDSGGARKASGEPRRVLCLTKGLGLAPVANYIRWAGGRAEIDVIADLEKINRQFAEYALCGSSVESIGGHVEPISGHVSSISDYVASIKFSRLPLNLSWAEEEKYDVIVISASDYYQQNIYVPEEKKVLSNNHTMCCGEGICGACVQVDSDGAEHRMCKSCRL